MTAVQPVTATPERPVPVLDEATAKSWAPAVAAAVITIGTLAFLAACAFVLHLSWSAGIPVVLVASIAAVLMLNRAVPTGGIVDGEVDAFERMLRENESDSAPTPTGVEAELALLAERVRAIAQATTARTSRWVSARSRLVGASGRPLIEPMTRPVRGATLLGTVAAARLLGDRLQMQLTVVSRHRGRRDQ
ncbi:MAG: hypothetical protein M3N46_08110 [Actinomycetota bacterium]|nr:hypothetical protein [Actinomycetota bacterium]